MVSLYWLWLWLKNENRKKTQRMRASSKHYSLVFIMSLMQNLSGEGGAHDHHVVGLRGRTWATSSADRDLPWLIWTKCMSAHSHNSLCEYLSFSQCCCFPVVWVALVWVFFSPFFRADVCPGACTLTLRCLHILIYERGDQHNILVEVFFCYYIAVVSFDLAWWFFLSLLRSLKSFVKVLLWKWVTLKKIACWWM